MSEKKKSHLTIFLVILIVLLATLQVIFLNSSSTNGEKLTLVSKQIVEREGENARLSQDIASGSAIATISIVAKEYGFMANAKTLSLSTSAPLAFFKRSSL